MTADIEQPPILLLMGPTASGKSALAIALAQALNGEVISVDSAQVYRGMDIGTAKPSLEEREGVPHHLLDLLDPLDPYSAGQFLSDATTLIANLLERGKRPILAGGTLLYFRALQQGLSKLPPRDPAVRERLSALARSQGLAALHQQLKRIDPEAALRIHPNDPQRIQRALELFEITGKPMSLLQRETPPQGAPYRWLPCLLAPSDRAHHQQQMVDRFKAMLKKGLIDEVQGLRSRGDLHPDLPSMRAVGYRQVWSYLDGKTSLPALEDSAAIATRQFAKRQMTWLRQESVLHRWQSENPDLLKTALRDLSPWILGA